MSNVVISVENVTKAYRLGMIGGGTLKEDFARWWARMRGKPDPLRKIGEEHNARLIGQEFWALQNVSFQVKDGEVLGIVGRNGAGKSTLLKILSQVTAPTSGEIKVKGRIASLLEVGTGFHPELTGRENIFLNGAILGMTKAEIRRKLEEIIDFSGIEEFIDTPVKRYSSGMYVRLAFAVAAHLEPEILVVDEVLAVGDASFQKKCLGKMGEAAKRGRTVLFVSHNMQAVMSLCNRAMLFEGGKLIDSGDPHSITEKYLKAGEGGSGMRLEQTWENAQKAPGNDHIRMRRVGIVPEKADKELGIDMETAFRLEIEYWNLVAGSHIIVNLAFYSLDDSPAFETFSYSDNNWGKVAMPEGLFRSVCKIPANLLNQGDYRIRIVFLDPNARTLFDLQDGAFLTIHNQSEPKIHWFGRFIGHLHPQLHWSTEIIRGEERRSTGNICVQFEEGKLGGGWNGPQ